MNIRRQSSHGGERQGKERASCSPSSQGRSDRLEVSGIRAGINHREEGAEPLAPLIRNHFSVNSPPVH
jgi:hypothetical protein